MTLIPRLSFYLNLNLFPMFVLNSYLTHVQIFNNLNLKILRSTLLSSLICQFWESKGHYSFPTYFKWFFKNFLLLDHFKVLLSLNLNFLREWISFLDVGIFVRLDVQPLISIRELVRTTGMFLALLISKGKIGKIVNYDQARGTAAVTMNTQGRAGFQS